MGLNLILHESGLYCDLKNSRTLAFYRHGSGIYGQI